MVTAKIYDGKILASAATAGLNKWRRYLPVFTRMLEYVKKVIKTPKCVGGKKHFAETFEHRNVFDLLVK